MRGFSINIIMATYSFSHKIIFIHIPKNSGTSVNFWMKDYIGGQKKGITHGGIHHLPLQYADYTTFTIIRNPWERTLSFWSFLKGKLARKLARATDGSKEQYDLQVELALVKSGFENWVYEGGLDYPNKTNPTVWFNYGMNQLDWIPQKPTFILRYEKLNKEFKKIQNLTGVTKPLRKSNQSKHEHYRTYYNPQLKNYVGDLFSRDIKRFKYSF